MLNFVVSQFVILTNMWQNGTIVTVQVHHFFSFGFDIFK
jgi:hypothetical protein